MWRTLTYIVGSVLLALVALLVGCAGFPMQSEPVVVKRVQMQMGTLVANLSLDRHMLQEIVRKKL